MGLFVQERRSGVAVLLVWRVLWVFYRVAKWLGGGFEGAFYGLFYHDVCFLVR